MDIATLDSFFSELDSITKEAGWGRDFLAWAKQRHRKGKKLVGKVDNAVLTGSIKAYQAMPEVAQKAVNSPQVMDPSDSTGGLAVGAAVRGAKHLLKVGSKSDERR